jgi:hypothetical protein
LPICKLNTRDAEAAKVSAHRAASFSTSPNVRKTRPSGAKTAGFLILEDFTCSHLEAMGLFS